MSTGIITDRFCSSAISPRFYAWCRDNARSSLVTPKLLGLRPVERKADRRSQKLPSNFSFITALLEESKAKLLRGRKPLDGRSTLPVGILLVLGLQKGSRIALEDTHGRFDCILHKTRPPRSLTTRSIAQAFTVSNASAEFVKRRAANAASISRKNVSRSASLANSIATPRSFSGASVGVARNSLTLIPPRPGTSAHPTCTTLPARGSPAH